jgi:hypothetical protein
MESIAWGNGLKSVVTTCSEPTALVVLQPFLIKLWKVYWLRQRIEIRCYNMLRAYGSGRVTTFIKLNREKDIVHHNQLEIFSKGRYIHL